MTKSILFLITGDPRQSPRPAEAIRIAAGVAACKKTEVRVYLRDAAVLALSEYSDRFVDDENYARYLPILADPARPVYVQRDAPMLGELGEPCQRFQEISDGELAQLMVGTTYLARF